MGKSHAQAVFEAKIRQKLTVGHPASPLDGGGGWEISCQRAGCGQVFLSPSRQRKYCSSSCRRVVAEVERVRFSRMSDSVLNVCGRSGCEQVFIPRREGHLCIAVLPAGVRHGLKHLLW